MSRGCCCCCCCCCSCLVCRHRPLGKQSVPRVRTPPRPRARWQYVLYLTDAKGGEAVHVETKEVVQTLGARSPQFHKGARHVHNRSAGRSPPRWLLQLRFVLVLTFCITSTRAARLKGGSGPQRLTRMVHTFCINSTRA